MGPPASGKDTQAEILAERYGFNIMSFGEVLREEVEHGGENAKDAKEYMERGELVPSELLFEVVGQYIDRKGVPENIVFTGAARRAVEIPFIDKLLAQRGGKVDAVIYLTIPDEESVQRISGRWYSPTSDRTYHDIYKPPKVPGIDDATGEKLIKREDDKPEVVRERLRIFHQELEPVKEEFESRGIWYEVDGTPSISEIHNQIVRVLQLDKQARTAESQAK